MISTKGHVSFRGFECEKCHALTWTNLPSRAKERKVRCCDCGKYRHITQETPFVGCGLIIEKAVGQPDSTPVKVLLDPAEM